MSSKKKTSKQNHTEETPEIKPEDDVGSSCSKPTEVPQIKEQVTEEKDVEEIGTSEQGDHRHQFKVRFDNDIKKYTVYCTQPRTVLQVITSHLPEQYEEKIKRPEKKIIIRLGEGRDSPIVATHFPCCCVEKDLCVTITTKKNKTQFKETQKKPKILPKENYSVFSIDKEGGEKSKWKPDKIFTVQNIVDQFKYFGVYGTKGMRVEEALRQDGRFVDGLTDFTLSDNKTGDVTNCTELVDNLDGKDFQICLPMEKKDPKTETRTVLANAAKNNVTLKKAMENTNSQIDLKEINEGLQKQFPKEKTWMDKEFPGNSFKEILELKKENFGKIQSSFEEVYTMRTLVNRSESICYLIIKDTSSDFNVQGTGFVLFDEYVLTNAHLFKSWQESTVKNWWEYLTITAEFNFEQSDGKSKTTTFEVNGVLGHHDLDFVLLQLKQTPDQTETKPQGLLERFGPLPDDGGACIIGHPGRGVKKMDVTCIIRNEDREQAVEQNLEAYKDYLFTVCSIKEKIKRDPYADIRVTYNTFMYHGSSGSPVFDASGRVFGLHSGGFFYDCPIPGHSVIEFAYPLRNVFKMLLDELQKNGREDLVDRIINVSKENIHFQEIIEEKKNQGRKDETVEQYDSVAEMDTSSN